MKKKKSIIVALIMVLVLVFSGCSNLGDNIADTLSSIGNEGNSSDTQKEDKTEKEDKTDKDSDSNGLGGLLGSLFGSDDKESDKDNSGSGSNGNSGNSLESLFGDLLNGADVEGLDGIEGLEGLEGLLNGNTGNSGNSGSDSGSNNSGDYGDYSYDDMMNAFDQLISDEDREKMKDYFKFPKCTKWSEWPGKETWAAMGMIDIQPKGCDFAKVQDDGQYMTMGFWNGYYADCQCDEGEFERITQLLWDSGYRGKPVGDGYIIEAESIDDIRKISEYSNTDFHAFYEYDGWVLCVEVIWRSWNYTITVGIYDGKTMYNTYPDLEKNPAIDKSKAEEAFPNGGFELIGSDFTGKWGEYTEGTEYDSYTTEHHFMYSRNVTPEQWAAYSKKLDDRTDIYCDGYGENGWEGLEIYYEKANPNGYTDAYVAYCEKAGLMYYGFYKNDY